MKNLNVAEGSPLSHVLLYEGSVLVFPVVPDVLDVIVVLQHVDELAHVLALKHNNCKANTLYCYLVHVCHNTSGCIKHNR